MKTKDKNMIAYICDHCQKLMPRVWEFTLVINENREKKELAHLCKECKIELCRSFLHNNQIQMKEFK